MKSLLNKRMQGFLVAVVVALVAGATGAATATAGTVTANGASASSGAVVSGLTAKQKKAKKKALKKCKKKNKKAAKRKACIKKVNKKYKKLAAKSKGKTKVVLVGDPYFYSPSQVKLKVNDSITWDWKNSVASEGHNVSLFQGPAGVSPYEFESPIMTGPNYKFTRKFKKAGDYHFVCSLHTLMTMDVKVTK